MKAVITCGGTGTRLLPFTKELPKEMAPVFIKRDSCLQTIPLIQLIFENLYVNLYLLGKSPLVRLSPPVYQKWKDN